MKQPLIKELQRRAMGVALGTIPLSPASEFAEVV
jgi:hypothetical protein